MVCAAEEGNAKYHVCPYHGWAYDASGKNVDIKDRKTGSYPPAFDAEDHDLVPLARVASYKGFIFGSLSDEVPPLGDFLGDMRFFIDVVADQGPRGLEFIPGRSVYTYRGNWKLQLDNGLDPYHLTTTHLSYMDLQARRRGGEGHLEARQYDWAKRNSADGGTFALSHGHAATWLEQPEPEKRPIYPALADIRARVGAQRAEWMLKARNVHVFPNMQIADAITLMLRTFRPLAVDRTEMKSWCLAPIGEAPELRAWRLRQFEDFFNPGGMATPDDTVTYEGCHSGFGAQPISFLQGYSRGMAAMRAGADEAASAIGIGPEASVRGRFGALPRMGAPDPGGLGGSEGLSVNARAQAGSLAAGVELVHLEARYLDEQRWDDWLALFVEDCEYWMPAWKADGTPTANPQAELSHIYYASRAGLEDRIVRIRSEKSPASTPMPRTAHVLGSVLPKETPAADRLRLDSTWVTHVFFPRSRESHAFFGRSEHELVLRAEDWRIAKKKILLQNDYIPTMLDVYCV